MGVCDIPDVGVVNFIRVISHLVFVLRFSVVELYLERVRSCSSSPSGRVVSGSASDNAGGSNTIQVCLSINE